jgi:hypothetical protein
MPVSAALQNVRFWPKADIAFVEDRCEREGQDNRGPKVDV